MERRMASEATIKRVPDLLTIETLGAEAVDHAKSMRRIETKNVVPVGISEKVKKGKSTGKMALTFYVEKKNLAHGQELGMRSGTEAVPSIVGLATTARLAHESLASFDRVRSLRDRFESSVLAQVEETSVNGATQERLGNTSNLSFHDAYAHEIVRTLDAAGVCVSAGAACHSGKVEPSGTMKAMGHPLRVAMGAVRFSLSRYTTAEEIDRAIAIVKDVVGRVRGTIAIGSKAT